ncbi:hypothetical protein [Dokdonia sp. Hel_I_53]|uniref:hypothetical protein n=1 Tax=Dokdonia sp. Hel_I_53 TaxID=1566287 RepID=UPI00119B19A7|nr:hypothetical protein [Dokdonia sp. Hel_I_53]TVZ52882.1 lysylphosphatidylglycerol synthase-like protein [Dokdonia sp. Hel_I_53]
MPRLSSKTKQLLWAIVKILILVAAAYFIYLKIDAQSLQELRNQLDLHSTLNVIFLVTTLLLFSTANWFFEVLKWKELVSYLEDIRFRESVNQTFTAHLIGFITPAKAGDYGSKAFFYNPKERKKILFLNFIGNMYQLLATLIFGFIGLGVIAFFTSGTAIFFWGLSIFMTLILYQITPKLLRSINWTLKGNVWYKIKGFWKKIPAPLKTKVRLLSILRYVIFAHQFYLILYLLGSDLNYPFSMACIFTMYVLSSLFPIMQLFDVVVRVSVAVIVFAWFDVAEEIVLMTVLLMWFFNVLLPLILGAYYLLIRQRPFKIATQ